MLLLGPPGSAVLLKLPRFCNEAICDLKNLSFGGGLACRCLLTYALIDPHIEALNRLLSVECFSQLGGVCRKLPGRYPRIVDIKLAEQWNHRYREVSHGYVLEGGESGVLEFCHELISDCSVDVLTLVVLTMLLRILPGEFPIVKGFFTCRDGWRSTGFSWVDEVD